MINKKLLWIYILSGSIYFTQGIEGLPSIALFAYMKDKLHFDPSTIMYLGAITSLAWIIKPIWGFIIDNYLSQKKWIILSLLGSLGICFYLGLSPYIPLFLLIPILTFANLTTAFRDVANDGVMCIEGKKEDKCSNIQSIQWIAITLASIVVGLFGGYIADHYSYKLAYLVLIPIYLIIISIVLQYKPTVILNIDEGLILSKSAKWTKNFVPPTKNVLWENIKSYKELFTNKQFLLGCLFLFVFKFAPGFGTVLLFKEKNDFNWSYTFISILGAIASLISIIGAIVYYKLSKKISNNQLKIKIPIIKLR